MLYVYYEIALERESTAYFSSTKRKYEERENNSNNYTVELFESAKRYDKEQCDKINDDVTFTDKA